jgi:hypothetical protein
MPAQNRVGRDQPIAAHGVRHQPAQRGEHRPVGPIQARLGDRSTQDRDLVAQHSRSWLGRSVAMS